MMRIIGGKFGGYKIQPPKADTTRPISDRAKEALFNMLGDIDGLTFVDVYAGSGSVGLEALSRGASEVVFIENNPEAANTIMNNAAHCRVDGRILLRQIAVESWVNTEDKLYDIVFADPPYDLTAAAPIEQLANLSKRLFIYKHKRRSAPQELDGMELWRSRRYGDSMISIYGRIDQENI